MSVSFVVCPSYHSATLLALLLNNHSRISALGDTNPTREYDQVCACGEQVSVCAFWQTVRQRLDLDRFAASGTYLPGLPWPLGDHHLEGGRIAATHSDAVNRTVGRLAASGADLALPLLWHRRSRPAGDFVALWREFYTVVCGLHGTSLVIDGTKTSRKAELIASRIDDVNVIHLVRDPRGFTASALRYRGTSDVRQPAWLWLDLHRRMEGLGSRVRYLRVRYEDLAATPEAEMASIFKFLGVPPEPAVGPPRFAHKHHLMGNAMVFAFDGRIELDERWRTDLSVQDQRRVMQLTADVADRYGYR